MQRRLPNLLARFQGGGRRFPPPWSVEDTGTESAFVASIPWVIGLESTSHFFSTVAKLHYSAAKRL
jgi:hypothetical protein